jgi:hypothetical protein
VSSAATSRSPRFEWKGLRLLQRFFEVLEAALTGELGGAFVISRRGIVVEFVIGFRDSRKRQVYNSNE